MTRGKCYTTESDRHMREYRLTYGWELSHTIDQHRSAKAAPSTACGQSMKGLSRGSLWSQFGGRPTTS